MEILISSYMREDGVHIGRSERDRDKWYLMDSDGVLFNFELNLFKSSNEESDLDNLNSVYWSDYVNAMMHLVKVVSIAEEPHDPI